MSYTYTDYHHHQFDHPHPHIAHQQHHPYLARQPTCWDPPWSSQTTSYQPPQHHDKGRHHPPYGYGSAPTRDLETYQQQRSPYAYNQPEQQDRAWDYAYGPPPYQHAEPLWQQRNPCPGTPPWQPDHTVLYPSIPPPLPQHPLSWHPPSFQPLPTALLPAAAAAPPYTADSRSVINIGVIPALVPNDVVHVPEEPVLVRVQENNISEQSTSFAEDSVSGEIYSRPENGDLPVTKEDEEEEVDVSKDVDEAQVDTEPVVEIPTIIDEALKKSYAPIGMHLKVTAATLSWFPTAIFVPFIEGNGVKEGVRSLIKGGAPPKFDIIDDGWQSVGMDPIIIKAKLDDTANFTNRLISFKENHKFQKDGVGEGLQYPYVSYHYTFDPGGDASPKLRFSTLFVASWFPP